MTHNVNETQMQTQDVAVGVIDDVQALRSQLSIKLVRALAIAGVFAAAAGTFDAIETGQTWTIPTYWISYFIVVALALWRKSPYVLQVWAMVGLLYVMGVVDFAQDGGRGSARAFMLIVPFLTGVFLDRRASVIAIALNTLTMVGFGVAYSVGWLTVPGDPIASDLSQWIPGTAVLLMLDIVIVGSLNFLVPRFIEALQRSRVLTQVLQSSQEELESQVAERTRDLERRAGYLQATSEVAREAATVLADPQQLLARVVNLISERFAFYHAGIFLLDEDREWAVLQAASSPGGQRMLARGHRLQVGAQGTVGYVTARGEPRIALDVGEDAVFFNNPDLPETRSAITLPLRARGEIIGALDVQSVMPGAFTVEDAEVLQALTDQVALAINNARLLQQAQASAEAERRARGELTHEAWAEMLQVQRELGFTKEAGRVVPVSQRWDEEMEMAIRTGEATTGGESKEALAVPIKVGDQTVAVLDAHLSAGEGTWTPERVELLDALSVQIGQALDRARLYEATQRRAAREQLVGEVTGRMREPVDLEDVLQVAVQEMRQALNLNTLSIRLRSPENDGASGGETPIAVGVDDV